MGLFADLAGTKHAFEVIILILLVLSIQSLMKICIVSDSHDHRDRLAAAVAGQRVRRAGGHPLRRSGGALDAARRHPARVAHPSGARQQPGRSVSPVKTGAQTRKPRALLRPGRVANARGQTPVHPCTTRTTPRRWRSPAITTWCATAMSTVPSSNGLQTSRTGKPCAWTRARSAA